MSLWGSKMALAAIQSGALFGMPKQGPIPSVDPSVEPMGRYLPEVALSDVTPGTINFDVAGA